MKRPVQQRVGWISNLGQQTDSGGWELGLWESGVKWEMSVFLFGMFVSGQEQF